MTSRSLRVVAACAAALFGVTTAWAQSSGQSPAASVPDKPGVVYAERARTTARVTAVDRSQRTVTLKGTDGRTVTLKVPAEAKNFDQIKPGDTLRAEYLDAVALYVRKSDAPPQAGEMAAVRLAPKGGQPGGMMVETVEITAKVQAIDPAERTVTLQGPGGGVRVVKLDDRVRGLDEVKPGDEVVVRHTQALALVLDR